MPSTKTTFNCYKNNIEKDIAVYEYMGTRVKLALEVNGVYHYPRNSEESLGRDVIKRRVLEEKLGYKVLTIPYFEWTILENRHRELYLDALIANSI